MATWDRVIGHVDMDSFYASVEVRDRPALAGKPLAVGGSADGRGVVSSASYEARAFGVRSAMPMSTALRKCPDLIVLGGDMAKYQHVSRQLRAIFDSFSPRVEPISLDEAFLDLTGSERLLGGVHEIGQSVRRRIRDELSLTLSREMSERFGVPATVVANTVAYTFHTANPTDRPDLVRYICSFEMLTGQPVPDPTIADCSDFDPAVAATEMAPKR